MGCRTVLCIDPRVRDKESRDVRPSAARGQTQTFSTKSDTVELLIVVSETGQVCSVHAVRGVDKEVDKTALSSVKSWRFKPAEKDGLPVMVAILVEAKFTRASDGTIAFASQPSRITQAP